MEKRHYIFCLLPVLLSCTGCGHRYTPKPEGYFRIDLPEHTYTLYSPQDAPYAFDMSSEAVPVPRQEPGEQYWLDISYPRWQVRIHCSYKPVTANLRELSDDAHEFVFKHSGKATSIPEQGYDDDEHHVHGVFYLLNGNTASPCQFYLTDSTHHFFRGAVYFSCTPNQDSIAPVSAFIAEDVEHLIESFRWK